MIGTMKAKPMTLKKTKITYQQSPKRSLSSQTKGDKMLIKPENAAKLGMHKKLDVWMLLSTLVLVPPEARGNSKPF